MSKDMETKSTSAKLLPLHKLFVAADTIDYVLMLGGSIGAAVHGLAMPIFLYILRKLLNGLAELHHDEMYHQVTKYAIYMVFLGIISMFSSWAEVAFWMQTGERQVSKLRVAYLRAMLKQDVAYFDVHAKCVSTISNNMVIIQNAISEKMGNFIHYFFTFVGGFIFGFATVWRLGLVTLAVIPLLAAVGGLHLRSLTHLQSKHHEMYQTPASSAEEVISQIRTVYSFVGERRALESYCEALKPCMKLGLKTGAVKGLGVGAMYASIVSSFAFLLWYGSLLVRQGHASGGSVLSTVFEVLVGGIALGQASQNIHFFSEARAAAYDVIEAFNHVPAIDINAGGDKLPKVEGHIELSHVNFSYSSRPDSEVLKDFSLVIPAGKCVALAGSSGTGKSTIIALIERFYDPCSGRIFLDGCDIKTLELRWLRSQILGLVSQEPILFDTSILQNILFGKPNATLHEVEEAARAAHAHSFIGQLPDGYNTQVGERGIQLSVGQKQRIAIARTIIRSPSVLLLDEATSALDAESEHVVQDALNKLMLGKTTIMVAHRLSSIQNADMVAVIQEGQLLKVGSRTEVLSEGLYRSIVQGKADELSHAAIAKTQSLSLVPTTYMSLVDEEAADHENKAKRTDYFYRLAKLNMPEWPFILLGSIAAVLAGVYGPVIALIVSQVLELYYNPDKEFMEAQVSKYSLTFACIGASEIIIGLGLHYSFGFSGEALTMRVREMMFKALTTFEVGWFEREENGSNAIASRLSVNTAQVKSTMADTVANLIQNASILVAALVIAFVVQWKVATVITATLPLLIFSFVSEQMFLKGFAGNVEKSHERASKLSAEALSNVHTVAALNAEDKVIDLVKEELKSTKRTSFIRGQVAGVCFGISIFLVYSSYGLGLWYGARLIRAGETDVGSVVKVFFVLVISSMSIGETVGLSPDIVRGHNALGSIFEILDRKSEIEPNDASCEYVKHMIGEIELDNVHFCYPSRSEIAVFYNLSLKVHAGESLALVGSSGSGKSSVIALVLRFYDPISGRVLVDGNDIRSFNLRSYRLHVGLVQQEPALFATSIYENILYGKQGATETEIIDAAKVANAHTFICALPEGYQTRVGEGGAQLSGGQKQRVAIARAVLKNPSILLLDEATSALDVESESLVQDALDRLTKSRTSIVVAHRLSTIQNAERIAVMQGGKVVEQGSHSELIQHEDGAYAQLIRLQQSSSQKN